jgi:hypothetical protein
MLLPAPLLLSQMGDLAAVELEARSGRLVLGRSGGGLTLFDLKLGKPAGTVSCAACCARCAVARGPLPCERCKRYEWLPCCAGWPAPRLCASALAAHACQAELWQCHSS